MANAPLILVPGWWLGAWAWDEVSEALRGDGHDVTALTLPGLEPGNADRSAITLSDHVDTGPPSGAPDPEFGDVEKPPPSRRELEETEPVDGLTDEHFERFRQRAAPEPGGAIRDAPVLRNDARLDVPSTVIATGFTSEQYKAALEEGQEWLAALGELRDLRWMDLPTSHWPMWSRPKELAQILGDIAMMP